MKICKGIKGATVTSGPEREKKLLLISIFVATAPKRKMGQRGLKKIYSMFEQNSLSNARRPIHSFALLDFCSSRVKKREKIRVVHFTTWQLINWREYLRTQTLLARVHLVWWVGQKPSWHGLSSFVRDSGYEYFALDRARSEAKTQTTLKCLSEVTLSASFVTIKRPIIVKFRTLHFHFICS